MFRLGHYKNFQNKSTNIIMESFFPVIVKLSQFNLANFKQN